ncbi:MAG: hypothetical protein BGO55_16445 [Sphingobacteriales bacterium 50-39]|nr:hypothetical protein [Sphingobacteriales bacterium]OJW56585.1 MAG: hypothetical protein BGO55_16445 [Sphingobacteriales bacterium 50-39]
MRRILFPLAVLLFSFPVFAQQIDSLRTDAEVEAFMRRRFHDEVFLSPPVKPLGWPEGRKYLAALGMKAYEKVDLDNNGYTDLLINGYIIPSKGIGYCQRSSFAVLAFGKDSFLIKDLMREHILTDFGARTMTLDHHVYIRTREVTLLPLRPGEKDSRLHRRSDTLVCVFGEFVENPRPRKYDKDDIRKIGYSVYGALGVPGFQISITGDSAILIGDSVLVYGHSDGIDPDAKFVAKVDPMTLTRIFGLLQYMNVSEMKDKYEDIVEKTDNYFGALEISFGNGEKKRIGYVGLENSYELRALFNIFEDMIKTHHWVRV